MQSLKRPTWKLMKINEKLVPVQLLNYLCKYGHGRFTSVSYVYSSCLRVGVK